MSFYDYSDWIEEVFRTKEKLSSVIFPLAFHALSVLQINLYDQWRNNEGGF